MEQKRLAELAAGRAHATSHTWRDWTVATRAAPIVRSSKLSVSPYSHGAWQRELGLTLYAGGLTSDPANFPQARTVLREAVAIPIQ